MNCIKNIKKYFFFLFLSLVLFSGCTEVASELESDIPTPPQSSQTTLSEKEVRDIARSEIEKIDFDAKVESGIKTYLKKQEEAVKKEREEASKPKKMEGISADDDPFVGDENAPVTIIEFSDFECPYCSRHVRDVYPQIKEKYIDTGKVKYVFRDFPLGFHKNAVPASVAANCAREQSNDQKYFEFHDKLFENQKDLNKDAFKEYANELGLNSQDFEKCLEKNDISEIKADMDDAKKYGITGTPVFFINGWQIKGAFPFSAFEELIEKELENPDA
jgi:protein-disulfide isomerase